MKDLIKRTPLKAGSKASSGSAERIKTLHAKSKAGTKDVCKIAIKGKC